jgi:N-acetylmuramoyl-L-alanine amidase
MIELRTPGTAKPAEAAAEAPKPALEEPKKVAEPPKTKEDRRRALAEARKPMAEEPKPRQAEPEAEPRAAAPTSEGSRSLTRALGLKITRVALDPGHGGNDHGTTGPDGTTEKDLVLDVALRLGTLIEQRLGAQVFYTRKADVFVPLEERTALANNSRADLFLSIHANSSPARGISGAEVYYLNFNTSREAVDVAARENASHGKSIFELRELIQKIALKDKLDESREFATLVQDALSTAWTKLDSASRNRGVKKAPFVVLIGASMPSILAEIGFLSNKHDEALLAKSEQRQKLAEALFEGIERYAAGLGQTRATAVAAPPATTPR